MATQDNPELGQMAKQPAETERDKQRELFVFFRGFTLVALLVFSIAGKTHSHSLETREAQPPGTTLLAHVHACAVPVYIYASQNYDKPCSVSLGNWQYSYTIFIWVMLAAFILAYGVGRFLKQRGSPGSVAFAPAMLLYIGTIAWLVYGTVLVAVSRTYRAIGGAECSQRRECALFSACAPRATLQAPPHATVTCGAAPWALSLPRGDCLCLWASSKLVPRASCVAKRPPRPVL
ncbi:hypothetical protein EON66_05105 [archaeon]|nr:MAG: hypothetical protein EON66_05105 [archaeon]